MDFIPKVGDIALFGENTREYLVEITHVKIKKIDLTKKVKTGVFSSETVKTGETIDRLESVWWKRVGDMTNEVVGKTFSSQYRWDIMIHNAKMIITQAKILLDEQKDKI
jgi:hypothetical protein